MARYRIILPLILSFKYYLENRDSFPKLSQAHISPLFVSHNHVRRFSTKTPEDGQHPILF